MVDLIIKGVDIIVLYCIDLYDGNFLVIFVGNINEIEIDDVNVLEGVFELIVFDDL